MKQKIIRVGNSAAVVIPKNVLEEANLEVGAVADVQFDTKTQS